LFVVTVLVVQWPNVCLTYSRFCGLFGSIHLEQIAQLHARLVQLRLAVADGAFEHGGNLVVFVAFNVVQYKNESVAAR